MFSHHLLFFSREATSETYGPPVSSYHICLCDLFSFAFIFSSTKPKIQKYLAAFYFICDLFILPITTFSRPLANFWRRYPKGINNPLTRRVASICYLCAGVVYVVLLGSPTGSITLVSSLWEIPTAVVCCTIPSPLGKYRRSFKPHHHTEYMPTLHWWIWASSVLPKFITLHDECHPT